MNSLIASQNGGWFEYYFALSVRSFTVYWGEMSTSQGVITELSFFIKIEKEDGGVYLEKFEKFLSLLHEPWASYVLLASLLTV